MTNFKNQNNWNHNNEEGNDMNNLDKETETQEQKGEFFMTRNPNAKTNRQHKVGAAYQANMIELFNYIYMHPNYYTKERLATEFGKHGKEDQRKILRMVSTVNNFCPLIQRTTAMDGRTHYSIARNISEKDIDRCYKNSPDLSVFYIYLKTLIKIVSIEEVMELVNVKKAQAKKIMENILDAFFYTDCIGDEDAGDIQAIGFSKFFS